MSENSNAGSGLLPALILSAAFLGGSLIVANALSETTEQVQLLASAVAEMPAADVAAKDRPSRPRGNRAEAGKEYKVDVGKSPVRGSDSALVTIVEFSDFQCPFCSRATPTLDRIAQEYGDKVRLAFKHFPLAMHPQAKGAHAAAEAAHRQGKFWEMHDKIFESPRDMKPATFERYATELDLDLERFKRDVVSDSVKKQIDVDMEQAQGLGVTGTPSFFINGRFLSGAQPFDNFKAVIDSALAKKS